MKKNILKLFCNKSAVSHCYCPPAGILYSGMIVNLPAVNFFLITVGVTGKGGWVAKYES